ncbi:MAG: response regulator [Planctomycetota bacterium]|jgi:DNA-binding NarL/FixJ family response regulator
MDNEAKIRILLVDDNEVFRIFLRSILQKHFGMEVVGEAANGRMAVELVQEHRPDVVFMDVHMPGMNGIEATREITRQTCDVKVLAFSSDLGRRTIEEMFKAGASGYLLKGSAVKEIISAIKTIHDGQRYLSKEISEISLKNYVASLVNVGIS